MIPEHGLDLNVWACAHAVLCVLCTLDTQDPTNPHTRRSY